MVPRFVFRAQNVFPCCEEVASARSLREVGELCDPRTQSSQAGSQELLAALWLYSPLEVSPVFARGLWAAKILVVSITVLIWILEDEDSGTRLPGYKYQFFQMLASATLGKQLNFPVPQFPHLWNANDNGTYCLGLLQGCNELIWAPVLNIMSTLWAFNKHLLLLFLMLGTLLFLRHCC